MKHRYTLMGLLLMAACQPNGSGRDAGTFIDDAGASWPKTIELQYRFGESFPGLRLATGAIEMGTGDIIFRQTMVMSFVSNPLSLVFCQKEGMYSSLREVPTDTSPCSGGLKDNLYLTAATVHDFSDSEAAGLGWVMGDRLNSYRARIIGTRVGGGTAAVQLEYERTK